MATRAYHSVFDLTPTVDLDDTNWLHVLADAKVAREAYEALCGIEDGILIGREPTPEETEAVSDLGAYASRAYERLLGFKPATLGDLLAKIEFIAETPSIPRDDAIDALAADVEAIVRLLDHSPLLREPFERAA